MAPHGFARECVSIQRGRRTPNVAQSTCPREPELMKSVDQKGWATLAATVNLLEPNHEVLAACRELAERTKKEQYCTIVVLAPQFRGRKLMLTYRKHWATKCRVFAGSSNAV